MPESAASARMEQSSLSKLVSQVIAPGLCVACGACVGLCPHLMFHDGRVAAPHDCGLAQGRCYDLCPVAAAPALAAGADPGQPIGGFLSIYQAKSAKPEIREKAQYGGVVSTLLALALEKGLVGEAVASKADQRGVPQGCRAKTPAEILAAAGSVYAAGAGLSQLNQALAENADHALAVVGLPCQTSAVAAMKGHAEYPAAARRIALNIGLFCTMNLDARLLRALYQNHGVAAPVERADFPPPPAGVYQVWHGGQLSEIPLEEVYRARLAGCALCGDLTAEAADISVGAAEGREGWNTLVARSQAGKELCDLAVEQGLLELNEMPAESLEHLQGAAANKRLRAAQAIKE